MIQSLDSSLSEVEAADLGLSHHYSISSRDPPKIHQNRAQTKIPFFGIYAFGPLCSLFDSLTLSLPPFLLAARESKVKVLANQLIRPSRYRYQG